MQREHEPVDLWDINFCTHGFRGSSYYWHPQILRPRDLFYRTDCIHSSKIIPNACHTVKYITRQSLVESGLITNVLTSMIINRMFYFWTEKTITDRKSCVPNPHSKLANWDTKWKRDRTPWNGRCPYRWELSIGEEPKSLYISRPVRYISLKYGFCEK